MGKQFGQMEKVTKVSIKMIKNMDKEFSLGTTVKDMKENGLWESKMEKESS